MRVIVLLVLDLAQNDALHVKLTLFVFINSEIYSFYSPSLAYVLGENIEHTKLDSVNTKTALI